jgi:hypothetical protein
VLELKILGREENTVDVDEGADVTGASVEDVVDSERVTGEVEVDGGLAIESGMEAPISETKLETSAVGTTLSTTLAAAANAPDWATTSLTTPATGVTAAAASLTALVGSGSTPIVDPAASTIWTTETVWTTSVTTDSRLESWRPTMS